VQAPSEVKKSHIFHYTVKFKNGPDGVRRATLNGKPFVPPSGKPLLMKIIDNDKLSRKSNIASLKLNNAVQIIIDNPLGGPHPFHLHGHHFWVVGMGGVNDGNFDENNTKHTLQTRVVLRDTVMVKERSYVVIR